MATKNINIIQLVQERHLDLTRHNDKSIRYRGDCSSQQPSHTNGKSETMRHLNKQKAMVRTDKMAVDVFLLLAKSFPGLEFTAGL